MRSHASEQVSSVGRGRWWRDRWGGLPGRGCTFVCAAPGGGDSGRLPLGRLPPPRSVGLEPARVPSAPSPLAGRDGRFWLRPPNGEVAATGKAYETKSAARGAKQCGEPPPRSSKSTRPNPRQPRMPSDGEPALPRPLRSMLATPRPAEHSLSRFRTSKILRDYRRARSFTPSSKITPSRV